MATRKVGKIVYPPEVVTRAFEYFATSRSLYSRLAKDYQLPSIRTLTRITSKVGSQDDTSFLQNVLQHVETWQRRCILMLDEVYVKAALTYHGGTLFGKSVDNPAMLANTVLAFMVKCCFGGPEFFMKLLPVSNLNADFLVDQTKTILEKINEQANGEILAIIADGNRVNQKFFRSLDSVEGKQWRKDEHTFLLHEYVQILKCICNNWLTEKSGELSFEFNGVVQVAKWSDLKTLHDLECNHEFKLSKINAVAISPKPIEWQRVDTCLRVFCDATVSALETHPFMDTKSVERTANFIKIILKFWKIVNVKGEGADMHFRDASQGIIRSPNDPRLSFLLDLAGMADKMKNTGGKRNRQLTKDTAQSLTNLCHGFVELAKYLLDCGNAYVIFRWFTTDPLEKCFSKLRQGSASYDRVQEGLILLQHSR